MNIDLGNIITIVTIVFSAGLSYGLLSFKVSNNTRKLQELETIKLTGLEARLQQSISNIHSEFHNRLVKDEKDIEKVKSVVQKYIDLENIQ